MLEVYSVWTYGLGILGAERAGKPQKNKVVKNWVCGYTATPNAAWGNEVSDQKTCTGMEKVVGP